MATIQDVAKHAKVGVGTVSRVLNGTGYVKNETRKRVEESIEALDYTPNEMARNLFFSKSGIVAVIVPELAHPFFAQFVNAAEAALCEKGYQTMICNAYYGKNYEKRYLELLKQHRVDGIIFGAHTTLDISVYQSIQKPIVSLDRNLGPGIPCVLADHRTGGRLAAEELLHSGCKNVVQFIGSKKEERVSTPSNVRHEIFAEIMKKEGVVCHSLVTNWHASDITYYQRLADELLESRPDTDGVFAIDMIAMAILQSAFIHRRRVPQDLKLVAYDGTPGVGLSNPRITAIVQPITRLAKECTRLIVDLIDGKPIKEQKVELPVSLRVGDTTTRV